MSRTHCRRMSLLVRALTLLCFMSASNLTSAGPGSVVDKRIAALLDKMTLTEKVGQMSQVHAEGANAPDELGDAIRAGRIGSVINNVDLDVVSELQRIAVEESRLGIPLLFGRDVIHGFRTIFPIPLGQAATWNPELVRDGARLAAREAATRGINWTFAPMMDITRDPRWGRIAESLGEDPYLASELAVAMVEGFQGEDLSAPGAIAATAKHFAGYGESESGRDYATTNIPENELRNVHLRPFRAAVDAGVSTVMPSFSDLNGVPASANAFLMRQVLRDEWGFDGFVISDWRSIDQLSIHGLTADDRESALAAATAGINMEMAGSTYIEHLPALVEEGRIDIATIDAAVAEILRTKFELGLFERPWADVDELPPTGAADALAASRQTALQSVVMLRNESRVLPLDADRLSSLAVIGPLADAPYEQLGTWVFDGDPSLSVTALDGLRDLLGDRVEIRHVAALETSRSRDTALFDEAVAAAEKSDAVVLFLGEESILSGEAHSRADIGLPGAQADLVRRIRATGKPVVAVILAGRPLTLADIVNEVDALLFAWHPGTMGGAAIADILFGVASPSGKLPVTFPRMVGQVPIYYSQKNTGKPPSPDTVVHIDDIDPRAPQTSFGMTAFHLDAGYTPQWEFGFGLSYASFEYSDLAISHAAPAIGDVFTVSAGVTNTGDVTADEIVQLYVRDLVGNVTRPVRELKGFRRVTLEPGETRRIDFDLSADDLAFYGRDNTLIVEPGDFHVWIGGSSSATLRGEFRLVSAN